LHLAIAAQDAHHLSQLTYSLYSVYLASNNTDDAVSLAITKDGSYTLYAPRFSSHYHSTHGARQESNHVFIGAGLDYYLNTQRSSLAILEMGFGSGLNALLAQVYAEQKQLPVLYETVEAYPIQEEIISTLNYHRTDEEKVIFDQLHLLSWDIEHTISDHFRFRKYLGLIEEVQLLSTYDIIFYDAFGPGSQPHLWQEEVLEKLCSRLVQGGILVTYCAQGAFKRALKAIGMQVEGIPGPPGKREMTRAIKL